MDSLIYKNCKLEKQMIESNIAKMFSSRTRVGLTVIIFLDFLSLWIHYLESLIDCRARNSEFIAWLNK